MVNVMAKTKARQMKSNFSKLLQQHMATVDLNPYRTAKATGLHEQYVYKLCRGEQRPSDNILTQFASVPGMPEISVLRAWRLLDEYGINELETALEAYRKGTQ